VTNVMNRGKQQVLLKYLPGKTFDFEKIGTIAQVDHIRGAPRTDLNLSLILYAIADDVSPWSHPNRPSFQDPVRDAPRFILLDPLEVETRMFPLTLWCQNGSCGVVRLIRDDAPITNRCDVCRTGRLVQSRFVRVHRCGALLEISPPPCGNCKTQQWMALDTRGSERILDFRWVCRHCNSPASFFPGKCPSCNWISEDRLDRNMNVEVHRAGRTYYPHNLVLLNQPGENFARFLQIDQWQAIAAAKYFGMAEVGTDSLLSFVNREGSNGSARIPLLSEDEKRRLRESGKTEQQIQQFEDMELQLRGLRDQRKQDSSPQRLATLVEERTGVPWAIWQTSGQEILEAILPTQMGSATDSGLIPRRLDSPGATQSDLRAEMGLASVTLVTDFPITNVTYGHSRVSNEPDKCRLNSFPADPDHGGKFPIFVDTVQADAILLRLNPQSVVDWLKANGCNPKLPKGLDPTLAAQSYFFELLSGVRLRETLPATNPEARLTFCLLHTLSHLSLRRAAWLCGLESTSLSEYVLPRTLTFAIYCNHRFGATIGALVALFEQSLSDWLRLIMISQKCVYDPVCSEHGGVCHSCTHLAETSCRFFNGNLSRSGVFGGRDVILGTSVIGYLPFVSTQHETNTTR
jgi:hypothetical protein